MDRRDPREHAGVAWPGIERGARLFRLREGVKQGAEVPRSPWAGGQGLRSLLASPLSVCLSLSQGSPPGFSVWLKPLIFSPIATCTCVVTQTHIVI